MPATLLAFLRALLFLFLLRVSAQALELDLRSKARWSMENGKPIRALHLRGDRLYVCGGTNGLFVVDVSQPESPRTLGHFDSPGDAVGVEVVGHTAYLADVQGGLIILDLADPGRPRPLGHFEGSTNALRPVSLGRNLLLADQQRGLLVLDVGVPSAPALVGEIDTWGGVLDLAVGVDHAYVVGRSAEVGIVDIRDPARPTLVTNLNFGSTFVSTVSLGGSTLYAGVFGRGIAVVDVSVPTQPRTASYLSEDRLTRFASACQAGGLGGMIDRFRSRFHLFQETGPATVQRVAELWQRSAFAAAMDSRNAYVATSQGTVEVIGLDEPARPNSSARQTMGREFSVPAAGIPGVLQVALPRALITYDASDPSKLVPIWTNAVPGLESIEPFFLVLSPRGDIGFLGTSPGMVILDLGNPRRPTILSETEIGLGFQAPTFGEDGVFWDVGDRLEWWDYSNPRAPKLLASRIHAVSFRRLVAQGAYLYALRSTGGVDVFEARRDTGLVPKATLPTENAFTMAVSGDRLVVAQRARPHVAVYSLADPSSPVLVGTFHGELPYLFVVLQDDHLYGSAVGDSSNSGSGRLEVLDLHDPGAIRRVGGNARPVNRLVTDGRSLFGVGQEEILAFPLLRRTAGPRFAPPELRDGRLLLRLEGEAGAAADIERSDSLGGWRPWRSVGFPQGTAAIEDVPEGPTSFYRIVPR